MEVWFDVDKKDVIEIVEKRKDCFPWENHPDEKYSCLIFREDGIIRMTVNEFFELDDHTFECCRYYTDRIADTLEEYKAITDEKIALAAYSAWCSGAR